MKKNDTLHYFLDSIFVLKQLKSAPHWTPRCRDFLWRNQQIKLMSGVPRSEVADLI